jgi:purine-binding chemotaxis protein CheW
MFRLVQDAESNEYLGFIVDGDLYCVNVLNIQEAIYIPPLSKIPNVPTYVEGAINLRGKIVRVINLQKWFNLPWKPFTEKCRILVITIKDGIFGIIVDELHEVFQIDKKMRHEIPSLLMQEPEISYIKSFILRENKILLEINPDKIRA